MANTITNTKIINSQDRAVIYVTLDSDGTNETGTVIYDSSTFAGTDTLDCRIMTIKYSLSAASTARAKLLFDATTDVLAHTLVPSFAQKLNYRNIGGLHNTAGTGKTGDILLTTTGLAAGDTLTLILELNRN